MTNTTKDTLTRAIAHLGAVEVEPGRYAWQEDDSWKVADATVVERAIAEAVREGNIENAAAYMGDDEITVLPAWWTPERRFAWRVGDGTLCHSEKEALAYAGGIARRANVRRHEDLREILSVERITADLNTGEEVPA